MVVGLLLGPRTVMACRGRVSSASPSNHLGHVFPAKMLRPRQIVNCEASDLVDTKEIRTVAPPTDGDTVANAAVLAKH